VLRGEAFGSAAELRFAKDVLLFGTGLGGGTAGARRWSSLAPLRGDAPLEAPPPFLELGLDLAATDAAIAAGEFSEDTRPELRQAARIQQRFRPLFGQYRAVAVSAFSLDRGRRMRLGLSVDR
jgi:hypothetical protein